MRAEVLSVKRTAGAMHVCQLYTSAGHTTADAYVSAAQRHISHSYLFFPCLSSIHGCVNRVFQHRLHSSQQL